MDSFTDHQFEVCAGDLDSLTAAYKGGADRVELCAALADGGLTPSRGLIGAAVMCPIRRRHVLLRSRGGDFAYNDAEKALMAQDGVWAIQMGVNGLVCGGLNADGTVDRPFLEELVDLAHAGGASFTFHRAFDLCRDPLEALDVLIDAGVDYLLTSGCAQSAVAGAEVIRMLVRHAAGRLRVIAAGGVNAANAEELLRYTGCQDVHASARTAVASPMTYRRPGVNMGAPGADEYSRLVTDPQEVARIAAIVHSFNR